MSAEVEATPSLWRNRDYVGWWVGETISYFGSQVSMIAYPLLILAVTGSPADAGIVASAESVGMLATMLLGGALADRHSRRVILILGALIEAVAVGSVAVAVIAGHVTLVHVAVVGLVQGVAGGLASGGWRPVLRRVVEPQQLPTAFAAAQARNSASRIFGPLAAGVLFTAAAWLPFGIDAVSFLASAGGVAAIRRPLGPETREVARERLFPSIAAGLRYIRRDSYLTYLTVWSGVMNCVLTGVMLLIIVLVKAHGGSAALVGAVNATGAVGGLVGALLATKIAKRVRGRALVLTMSWIIPAVLVGMAVVASPWAIGVLVGGMMFFLGPTNVVFSTYETRMIPDELSGRVSNAIDFGSSILRWAGPLGAGLLASAFSPEVAMAALAVPVVVLAVTAHQVSGLRVLDRPIDEIVPVPV